MTPVISVVIPVLNMADTIGPCLDALLAQRIPAAEMEIIVVDNGSTDGTQAVVDRYAVTSLSEPLPGAANARNRGIRAARGTLVAFTDADCVPSRGWLSHFVGAAGREGVDVVAGPMAVLDPEHSLLSRYSASVGQYDPARSLSHPLFPYAVTANLCIRRSTLESVGLFNPAFPTFDAAEFFWRLLKRGPLSAVVEPRAVVFYRTRSTVAAFLKQNYGYGRGAGRLLRQASGGTNGAARPGVALRSWRSRMGDAGRIARAAAGPSHVRAASLYGLHLLRESAIAAGFIASTLDGRG